jgi:hypothetical protein
LPTSWYYAATLFSTHNRIFARLQEQIFLVYGGATMSASIPNPIQQSNTNASDDAGYSWFVANSTELYGIFASDNLLRSLENLELQLNLPEGTAKRFKALYDHACNVSEHEEVLYAITWDAYHEALDSDPNLAAIANAYAQSHPIPLHRRMDATGTLIF